MSSIQRNFAPRGLVIRSAITPKIFTIKQGGQERPVLTTYNNGILGLSGLTAVDIAIAESVGQKAVAASVKQGGQHNITGLTREFYQFIGRVLYNDITYIQNPVVTVPGVAQQIQLSTYSLTDVCTSVTNGTSFYSDDYPTMYILTQPVIVKFQNPQSQFETVEIFNALETGVSSGGGGGSGQVVEVLNGTTPSNPNADVTIIESGTHALPISGATVGMVKTVIAKQDPVYTPFFCQNGKGNGTPVRFYNPLTSNQSTSQVRDIVELPNNRIAVIGNFNFAPGLPPPAGQTFTNARGIFIYNLQTGQIDTLGTGLSPNTSNFTFPLGSSGIYNSTLNRLYVFGGFLSAGGVANTQYCAYWDFSGSSWNSMGANDSQWGAPTTHVANAFVDISNTIVITGSFSQLNNNLSMNRVAIYNISTNTFTPLATGISFGAEVRGGFRIGANLYFYGQFSSATPAIGGGFVGTDNGFFCGWNGSAFFPLGKPAGSGSTFQSFFNVIINSAVANASGTEIYATGSFNFAPGPTASGVRVDNVARYTITNPLQPWTGTWIPLGTGFGSIPEYIGLLNTGELVASSNNSFNFTYGVSDIRLYRGVAYYNLSQPGSDWYAKGGGVGGGFKIIEKSPNELWILAGSAGGNYNGGPGYGNLFGVFLCNPSKTVELTGSFTWSSSPTNTPLTNLQLSPYGNSYTLVYNGTSWNINFSDYSNQAIVAYY